jgi:hypothetical protein
MIHHYSGRAINPASGGDAQPQWLAPGRVPGRETRDPLGNPRQYVGRWPAIMRV